MPPSAHPPLHAGLAANARPQILLPPPPDPAHGCTLGTCTHVACTPPPPNTRFPPTPLNHLDHLDVRAALRWLAEKLGGKPTTMSGLSGLGDIMLTCYGDLSRNRTVGIRLGRGEKLEDILASSPQVGVGGRGGGVGGGGRRRVRVRVRVFLGGSGGGVRAGTALRGSGGGMGSASGDAEVQYGVGCWWRQAL